MFVYPNMLTTPVLLLIFNRPDTTEQLFHAISQIQPPKIYIAADGPRLNIPGEKELCLQTKAIFEKINWDCTIKTLYREQNLGCCNAVKSAIDWFFEHEEMGIILEDDCIPTNSFFTFSECLLNRYHSQEQLMMIGGLSLFKNDFNYPNDYYFSSFSAIWGWASWRRAWKKMNLNVTKEDLVYFNKIQNLTIRKSYVDTLNAVIEHKINTWDVQWMLSILKNDGACINPIKNQIRNIGFTGTHSEQKISLSQNLAVYDINIKKLRHPVKIEIDTTTEQKHQLLIEQVINNDHKPVSLLTRIKNKIKRTIKNRE